MWSKFLQVQWKMPNPRFQTFSLLLVHCCTISHTITNIRYTGYHYNYALVKVIYHTILESLTKSTCINLLFFVLFHYHQTGDLLLFSLSSIKKSTHNEDLQNPSYMWCISTSVFTVVLQTPKRTHPLPCIWLKFSQVSAHPGVSFAWLTQHSCGVWEAKRFCVILHWRLLQGYFV